METTLEELKRYVRFSGEDARRLAAFRAIAEPHFERIAMDFWDRVREHEGAAAVMKPTDDARVAKLRAAIVAWLGRLLSGRYDEEWFEGSAKVGRVHASSHVPQRYVVSAMSVVRTALERITEQEYGKEGAPLRETLHRVLDLELAIILDAYRETELGGAMRARASVDALAAATEHAGVIIVGVDDQGAIRVFNGEAERLSGWGREEVLGQPFVTLLLGDEADADRAARVARVLSGAVRVDRFDARHVTHGGAVLDLRWELTHHGGATASGIAMFAVAEDVTEQRAEVDRTLRQERLEAVGNLAAGLAHEIRNPLNGAQLHLAFLERALKQSGTADPEVDEALDVVGKEIKRLAQLVSEFLEFARPHPLSRESVSLHALCERVVAIAGPEAAAARVTLATDLPSVDVVLDLDLERMKQLLLNLLQNAIEALAAQDGGLVTLRARRRARSVAIEVEDDGPGLASEDAPVFDAFYSTKPNGTGLGLAIAHRIALDHDGTIDVSSRPGRTCFTIVLPTTPEKRKEPT